MTDQKHTKDLEAFEDVMKERWCQLKGYWSHPAVDKCRALPDECPTCSVNLKLFFEDCKKHVSFMLDRAESPLDLRRERDELRDIVSKYYDLKFVSCDCGDEEGSICVTCSAEEALTKTKESK